MLLRAVVGAVAGAMAGAGLLLTVYAFAWYCDEPGRTGCGGAVLLLFPSFLLSWMFLAAVLITSGFRLGCLERGWWTAAIGSGLWVVLGLSALYVDASYLYLYREDDLRFKAYAAVIVPCLAYTIASLGTGVARLSRTVSVTPLRRGTVGAVSGAVAGFCLQGMFSEHRSAYYGTSFEFSTLPIWMLVGSGLTAGGLVLFGAGRGGAAAWAGFVLWAVLGVCAGVLGMFSLEVEVLRVVTVLLAAFAYALGAVVTTSRARDDVRPAGAVTSRSAPGETAARSS
ncbi:hypothetical protein [Lentzea flaviverrucosa]|uniref:Uncharacterized protein n=1 Tax=Lentzea flaviverrucosa TaxID=200379 RepID=A0A1H9LW53_9PSEU|nr:hypothetical protein [Lentzea flaviverrucosa]RDI31165.1 hypothetical protein DFR72_104502 [Lentzea flaviverrucosa]SER15702.1 hypothetical protein SAMN05216195_104124 [Lentzea flaviverrucosa]